MHTFDFSNIIGLLKLSCLLFLKLILLILLDVLYLIKMYCFLFLGSGAEVIPTIIPISHD